MNEGRLTSQEAIGGPSFPPFFAPPPNLRFGGIDCVIRAYATFRSGYKGAGRRFARVGYEVKSNVRGDAFNTREGSPEAETLGEYH